MLLPVSRNYAIFALWSSEISFVFETFTISVNSFKYYG